MEDVRRNLSRLARASWRSRTMAIPYEDVRQGKDDHSASECGKRDEGVKKCKRTQPNTENVQKGGCDLEPVSAESGQPLFLRHILLEHTALWKKRSLRN